MGREQAREALLELLPPGARVFTVLRRVSSSGMTRWIDCYVMGEDGSGECGARWVSRYVAEVAGYSFDERRDCLKVSGTGMDMGFAVVYDLAGALYPEGFECVGDGRELVDGEWTGRYVGPRCGSNDHANNPRGPYGAGVHHGSGGYALRAEWL